MVKKQPKKEIEIEDIPFVGGLLKGLEKLVDLAERAEQAGGEIRRTGKIKGLGREAKGIYGFSVRTGIGGRPRVQTFGNIRSDKRKTGQKDLPAGKAGIKVVETREPLVDVFDEKDHIMLIAELPGATEESIKLKIKGDILILQAQDEKRKYSKEILLPAKVDFEEKDGSFKNGILEIILPKVPKIKKCPQPKKKH